jgi:exopolyphosphatase/guanosine-5'-triphosphate,3'-diphosphate pyrophosphatase
VTRLAALDLGSNSFHLLVADELPGGRIKRVTTEKVALRLAEPVASTGELGKDARRRAAATFAQLLAHARQAGARRVLAVATEASRRASDGGRLLDRLASEHGIRVHVLSGMEEGELSLLGMAGAFHLPPGRQVLGLDLGGGSYEVAYGGTGGLVAGASLPLGPARLRSRLVGDPPRLLDRAELHDAALRLLRPVAADVAKAAADGRPPRAVGTAGTIRDLGRLGLALAGGATPDRVRGLVVTRDQLERGYARLVSVSTTERMELPGVSPKRADLLPAGGLVLLATMEAFGLEHLELCDWGLREGVLLDVLGAARVVSGQQAAALA